MKNLNTYKYFFIIAIFLLVSCEKTDSLQQRGITANGASIKAMHLSPDAPAINLMVDSIKTVGVLSTTAIESGFVFGNIFPSLSGGYGFVPSGTHTISAKVPFSSTVLPGQTITSKSVTLEDGKFYTVAILDSLSKLEAVIVEDKLDIPDTSKSYFRIANYMMKGTADVEFTSSTITGYTFQKNGIAYKTTSNFDTLSAGTYKILLRSNGSSTRLDSITAFAPAKGRKYTLYTRGVVGQTGSTNTRRPLIFSMTNY
jgi:hypothetical protein